MEIHPTFHAKLLCNDFAAKDDHHGKDKRLQDDKGAATWGISRFSAPRISKFTGNDMENCEGAQIGCKKVLTDGGLIGSSLGNTKDHKNMKQCYTSWWKYEYGSISLMTRSLL